MTTTGNPADKPVFDYSKTYLNQYWPEFPQSAVGWADNAVLMLSYQEAALAIKHHFGGRTLRTLDISTGPALAPLLAMITCVSEVQLSDFHAANRLALQKMPIEYWRNYVPMLIKLFDHPEKKITKILARLDELRTSHVPLKVDLLRDTPFFSPAINPHDYELISMQFVADGIVETEAEFLRCLAGVTGMVRFDGGLIMSAIVDSKGWQLGSGQQPSPDVSEETIVNFLTSAGFKILHLSRSMRQDGLTYSGGWIVLSAVKLTKSSH